MGRLQDKICVITGGASGIGEATVLAVAREGGRVVITDLNVAGGETLCRRIAEKHGADRVIFLPHDVTRDDDWRQVMVETRTRFGRIDVLVNNAGILLQGSIEDASLDQWHKLMRVNADSVFLGCKHAVANMKESGGGVIVNLSSITGLTARPDFAAYSASKHAVLGLSRAVAIHCRQKKYRIRCNTVHPDGVLTPMTLASLPAGFDAETLTMDHDPMGRMCRPEDVANTVLFLASDESRAINGAEVRVDGGQFLMSL